MQVWLIWSPESRVEKLEPTPERMHIYKQNYKHIIQHIYKGINSDQMVVMPGICKTFKENYSVLLFCKLSVF